jgi:hypothetical protein
MTVPREVYSVRYADGAMPVVVDDCATTASSMAAC